MTLAFKIGKCQFYWGLQITRKIKYLNEKALNEELAKSGIKFELLDSVGSTNDYLREKVKKGEIQQPWAVVAINQTEGKGTKGRKWISDDQSCLKKSLCVPFKRRFAHKVSLSPAVALATCKTLLDAGFSSVELKWPNDLLKNGRKVGGILLESISDGDQTFVITGIGLNLYPTEVISMQLDRQPGFLYKKSTQDPVAERTDIALKVLKGCAETVFDFRFGTGLPDPLSWNKHDRLLNKSVTVRFTLGSEITGVACGIDSYGRFLLKTSDGKMHALEDGEVEIGYGSAVN